MRTGWYISSSKITRFVRSWQEIPLTQHSHSLALDRDNALNAFYIYTCFPASYDLNVFLEYLFAEEKSSLMLGEYSNETSPIVSPNICPAQVRFSSWFSTVQQSKLPYFVEGKFIVRISEAFPVIFYKKNTTDFLHSH